MSHHHGYTYDRNYYKLSKVKVTINRSSKELGRCKLVLDNEFQVS